MNDTDTTTRTTDAAPGERELYPLPAFVTFAEPPSGVEQAVVSPAAICSFSLS